MRVDNSRFLAQAARRRSAATRSRAVRALGELAAAGEPVSVELVARRAGVSRSWLYGQQDLLAEIQQLRGAQHRASATTIPAAQRTSEASLRRRLELALDHNRRLTQDNQRLRQQLAVALGERRTARSRS